jgi:hypothetical protein
MNVPVVPGIAVIATVYSPWSRMLYVSITNFLVA